MNATVKKRAPHVEHVEQVEVSPAPGVDPTLLETLQTAWTYCIAAGKRLQSRWLLWLGGISAVLAAVSATTVFASLGESPSNTAKYVVGTMVVASAVLTATQTFLSTAVSDLAKAQKSFDRIHKEITSLIFRWTEGRDISPEEVKDIVDRYSDIDISVVKADGRRWRKAEHEMQVKFDRIFPDGVPHRRPGV